MNKKTGSATLYCTLFPAHALRPHNQDAASRGLFLLLTHTPLPMTSFFLRLTISPMVLDRLAALDNFNA